MTSAAPSAAAAPTASRPYAFVTLSRPEWNGVPPTTKETALFQDGGVSGQLANSSLADAVRAANQLVIDGKGAQFIHAAEGGIFELREAREHDPNTPPPSNPSATPTRPWLFDNEPGLAPPMIDKASTMDATIAAIVGKEQWIEFAAGETTGVARTIAELGK